MTLKAHIKTVVGRFWRATFLGQEDKLLTPAQAPRGRWHHSKQNALYLSGTPDGCRIAVKAYLQPNDPPRGIFPVEVSDARVLDLRDPATRDACSTSLADMHAFWADLHAFGHPSPTWDVSDKARASGVDGLLTPSRSRPDLTHLTLFRWNESEAAQLSITGNPEPF